MPPLRPFSLVPIAAVLAALPAVAVPAAPLQAAPHAVSTIGASTHSDSLRWGTATVPRALVGRSGSLRALVVDAAEELPLPLVWSGEAPVGLAYAWAPTWGTAEGGPRVLGAPVAAHPVRLGSVHAPAGQGVWRLGLRAEGWSQEVAELVVITRVPFAAKRNGYLNGYHIGRYSTEGDGRSDAYAPPTGFIEVTPENQDLRISEHFRLRNFLTKDQHGVWPKYVALDLRLIDKLELVLQELRAMGVRADGMAVMSGFRTPQYNGPGEGGRARLSRHTYGDAADVWVDSDADGYIDDLNGDGHRDTADAEMMLRAVERVEARFPELVGGCGVYAENTAHGPFVHIDVRGVRSRW
ncbi:MAG: D-Ala-D-Ala carboxypeptidase family metallohydrolase [Gemmatimonadota bacterium]|jgi:uncharacterized protein YcbK (DUF882 family)|nr:D-Ala-D-Ala carboxypeptidase family metallohydrolase [Gemmatimonadota bacterium]